MNQRQLHFVTGRLAERALRAELERLSRREGFAWTVQVMPISVAALMTGGWIASRLEVPGGTSEVILPGYAASGLESVQAASPVPVRIGPRDLRDLPGYFGQPAEPPPLGHYDIQIIAEINHARTLDFPALLATARRMAADGADLIDLGCDPGGGWSDVGEAVRLLKGEGLRVSIDSFDPAEVGAAVAAGAELVLSVNSSNCEAARDWGVEVVVVPDWPGEWTAMEETLDRLHGDGVRFRIDPVLEPVGIGFSQSLLRYCSARARWPDLEILMGTGNLTELTDADSAAVNLLLAGICQEQGIRSLLTTEVVNWARSSVRECDIARRMVWSAVHHRVPLKRISEQLVILRDARLPSWSNDILEPLAAEVKDRNYRIFADDRQISVAGDRQLWQGRDPFVLFDSMLESQSETLEPGHAFYLGYEMGKAELAMQLGKRYTQDESLNWGYLTVAEPDRHRLKQRRRRSSPGEPEAAADPTRGDPPGSGPY